MNKQILLASLATASTCMVEAFAAEPQQRPNVLWLTYEDTSPQFIGCYGNEMAITPTMDALAADGVMFSNAFSTGTVSSASRFCLMTGCRPARYGTGNHRSGYIIPEFIHGFPEYLKNAGYYTSNDVKTDYNHAMHRKMALDSWCDWRSGATWRGREEGQPFFAVYNSVHSHQSRTMTNPWYTYEEQILKELEPERTLAIDAPFEIPYFYGESPEMRKQVSRIYNSIARTDQDFARVLQMLEEDGLRDSTIIFCFSDHGEGMPRAKGSAVGTGYKVPFIMWIPEMYKDLTPWGSGVITDELVSFDDFGATILSLAGVEIPDYVEGTPFLPKEKLANRSEKKKYVFGACDAVDNNIELARTVTDGDFLYTRVFTNFQPFVRWIAYYDHADIQKQMRYELENGLLDRVEQEILQPRDAEYLYDLKNDRWELVNLATSPLYKEKMEEMRAALKQNLLDTRDAHFMPEYTLGEYFKVKTPYDLRLDNDFYPFEEILDAAYLCGMGEEVIAQQLEQLAAKNDFVTYWASIGLFTQREALAPYIKQLTKLLPKLTYTPTRIWVAAAILNVEDNKKAREVINAAMMSSNDHEAITGFNALQELNIEMAKTFIPQFRKIEEEGGKQMKREIFLLAKQRIEGIEFVYEQYW